MKKINLSFVIVFALIACLVNTKSFAQKISEQTSTYVRNGLSIHFIPSNSFSPEIINSIKVSEKYDDNSFGDNILRANIAGNLQVTNKKGKNDKSSNSIDNEINSSDYKVITDAIASQKIPNKILSKILLNEKGQLDFTKTIFPRGLYNATDNTMITAQTSNESMTVLQTDAIFNVLKNIYFLVQLNGTVSTKSSKDGATYTVPFKSYLFQVDLSDLINANLFFKTFDKKDPSVSTKINDYTFNVKLISFANGEGSTLDKELEFEGLKLVSKPKSQQQIYKDLAAASVDESLVQHSNNYEPFKVRTRINSVGPITAKIGKKEGLKIDDHFEVFRNKIDEKTGDKFAKKIGYVRVAKVADNAKVSTGDSEPSRFYKAPAGSVEKNDVMKEIPETGIQVGTEILFGDGYTSPMVNIDYVTHLIRGNRLTASYMNYEGTSLLLAEARQIIQLNRLTFTPGFGYIFPLSSDGKASEKPGGISTSFKVGLDFGKHFEINAGPRFLADEAGNTMAAFGFGLRLFGF